MKNKNTKIRLKNKVFFNIMEDVKRTADDLVVITPYGHIIDASSSFFELGGYSLVVRFQGVGKDFIAFTRFYLVDTTKYKKLKRLALEEKDEIVFTIGSTNSYGTRKQSSDSWK